MYVASMCDVADTGTEWGMCDNDLGPPSILRGWRCVSRVACCVPCVLEKCCASMVLLFFNSIGCGRYGCSISVRLVLRELFVKLTWLLSGLGHPNVNLLPHFISCDVAVISVPCLCNDMTEITPYNFCVIHVTCIRRTPCVMFHLSVAIRVEKLCLFPFVTSSAVFIRKTMTKQ